MTAAAKGKVWLCMACGRTKADDADWSGGWDESCAVNALEVDETAKAPTPEQVVTFNAKREAALNRPLPSLKDLLSVSTDPDLLELAQRAIDRRNGKEPAA